MDQATSASDKIGQQSIMELIERSELHRFIEQVTHSDKQLLSFTFPVPQFDPLACLEMLTPTDDFNFYWENPDQEFALSAGGEQVAIKQHGKNRFETSADQIKALKDDAQGFSLIQHSLAGIHLLGGFSFFDQTKSERWTSFGSGSLTVPKWLLIRDGKLGLLTITLKNRKIDTKIDISDRLEEQLQRFERLFQLSQTLPEHDSSSPTIDEYFRNPDRPDPEWIGIVEEAKELIIKQKFDKIVLAREVVEQSNHPIVPTHVLNTLRNQYPSCYNFMIRNNDGKAFIGCSPERLVSFKKNYLLTESLAGSISRGKTATEDVHLENHLLNSDKNRREHHYVTSAIENNLEPFIHKIERAQRPDIKKLKNVQHLYTPVRAWLKKDINRFSILEKLHPTPAVGGHPREDAVPYIRQLEQFDRGWYAGPVGWFNLNGGGEFAVAIRSSLIDGDKARIYAGCGIVEDSDPYAEWEETNLKLMPILSALKNNDHRKAE